MARPKNPTHRDALLAAAARTFAHEGLGASTANIAKAAGVSAGTLFVHFESKSVLVNELYVSLKTEMGRAAIAGLTDDLGRRDRLQLMWNNWITWATMDPERQRAVAHLSVAENITAHSRDAVSAAYAGIAQLVKAVTADGPMNGAPLPFVVALASALADATVDDLIRAPDPTGHRRDLAFEALWRALAG
ncbi:TetR/AcrR family transcriptional regulator [Arthrobacter cryoconiti]|uniref:TetR/AcrR family transcriptional regulator n=1 Tax=Arthrobacter cryoconiti TaxID=748907 RepID=A0ABV8QYV8_9MICC|nr:TetR/AcrR family transcriptional regulator [Arthrobacter cryoconiti]MCC9069971.1 TetR/AcrR family transcriptional regulator [Arthrobacter cryoconiti]